MDKLHLSDLGWIAGILVLYVLISNGAVGLIVRQVRRSLSRTPPPPPRVMSRRPASMRRARRYGSVYVPVSGMPYQSGGMARHAAATPDMDAVNGDMPRLSRDISDEALIVYLAVLRGPGGKPRYSANAIFKLVGGDRNAVLARIGEIRDGPSRPSYPKLGDDKRPILT